MQKDSLKTSFHRYLLSLFVHKLIRLQLSKKYKNCENNLKISTSKIDFTKLKMEENKLKILSA